MPNSFTAAPGELEYDRDASHDDGSELCSGICPACGGHRDHRSDCSELARMERISAQIRQREQNDAIYVESVRTWFKKTERR